MTVRLLVGGYEPPRAKRSRSLRIAEFFFLIAGLVALDYWVWITLNATLYQSYENWAFDQQLAGAKPNVWHYVEHVTGVERLFGSQSDAKDNLRDFVPKTGTASRERTPRAVAPEAVLGRIEIPRVRVNAIVREGVDDGTLKKAVGHVPSTALPGDPGNVALAAHRDTFFRGLRDIRAHDVITLQTLDGSYNYSVESTEIVMPTDVSVLGPSRDDRLTLVTCYPFNFIGSAPKRFIVRAKRVAEAAHSIPRRTAAKS